MEGELLRGLAQGGPIAILFVMFLIILGRQIFPLWKQNIEVLGQCIEVMRECSNALRECRDSWESLRKERGG